MHLQAKCTVLRNEHETDNTEHYWHRPRLGCVEFFSAGFCAPRFLVVLTEESIVASDLVTYVVRFLVVTVTIGDFLAGDACFLFRVLVGRAFKAGDCGFTSVVLPRARVVRFPVSFAMGDCLFGVGRFSIRSLFTTVMGDCCLTAVTLPLPRVVRFVPTLDAIDSFSGSVSLFVRVVRFPLSFLAGDGCCSGIILCFERVCFLDESTTPCSTATSLLIRLRVIRTLTFSVSETCISSGVFLTCPCVRFLEDLITRGSSFIGEARLLARIVRLFVTVTFDEDSSVVVGKFWVRVDRFLVVGCSELVTVDSIAFLLVRIVLVVFFGSSLSTTAFRLDLFDGGLTLAGLGLRLFVLISGVCFSNWNSVSRPLRSTTAAGLGVCIVSFTPKIDIHLLRHLI